MKATSAHSVGQGQNQAGKILEYGKGLCRVLAEVTGQYVPICDGPNLTRGIEDRWHSFQETKN